MTTESRWVCPQCAFDLCQITRDSDIIDVEVVCVRCSTVSTLLGNIIKVQIQPPAMKSISFKRKIIVRRKS